MIYGLVGLCDYGQTTKGVFIIMVDITVIFRSVILDNVLGGEIAIYFYC